MINGKKFEVLKKIEYVLVNFLEYVDKKTVLSAQICYFVVKAWAIFGKIAYSCAITG